MTTLNDIRVALESHLADLSVYGDWGIYGTWNDDVPTTNEVSVLPPVAWPNVPYTPTPDSTYLRVEFIPVLRRPVVAGPRPEQRLSGLFYITIFTPEEKGAAAGMALADYLLAWFNGSSSIIKDNAIVRLEYSEAKMPLHDPPFYAIPVEVGWYSYATP